MFKKTTKIFRRLVKLHESVRQVKRMDTSKDEILINYGWGFYIIILNTTFGVRKLNVSLVGDSYYVFYYNEDETECIFNMIVSSTKTQVSPMLIDFKAKDIDLAILEIENKVAMVLNRYNKLKLEHERQIKLLEN